MRCMRCNSLIHDNWVNQITNTYACSYCGNYGTTDEEAPAPKPKLNDDPVLYAEPIVGWRCWHADPVKCHIHSGMPTTIWHPGKPLRAVHQDRDRYARMVGMVPMVPAFADCGDAPCKPHEPNMRPGCGIYASKTPADIAHDGPLLHDEHAVFGRVYLWGRIFEHEHGYRAQYAYPAAFVGGGDLETVKQLADVYNVPFEPENETWKSVCRFVALSRNPSSFPSHYAPPPTPSLQFIPTPRIPFQPVFQPNPNASPFTASSFVTLKNEEDDVTASIVERIKAHLFGKDTESE